MASRRVAELTQTCLTLEYDPQRPGQYEYADGAIIARLECMDWLQRAGYPVDDFTDVHAGVTVKQDDEDSSYLVGRLETLKRPTEQADVAVDQYEFWACSCPDFHYRQFPDLDADEGIESVGECPHVVSVAEGQETIV